MNNQIKRISLIIFAFCVWSISYAKPIDRSSNITNASLFQIDSLIKQKNINNDMTKLDLLVLYQKAYEQGHQDSVKILKNLSLLNADLEQPKDAYIFTKKYIQSTLDFSILKDRAYDVIKNSEEYDELSKDYILNIDWVTFIFLYVALIGFFFTVVINFTKKSDFYSKLFISGFVGVHSFFILEFVLYISNIQYRFPHSYLMASIVALLYGPLLYFYFKSVTTNFKFSAVDTLHFLPTIILIAFLLPMYLLPGDEKIRIMLEINNDYESNRYIIFISKVISLAIYAFFIGKLQYSYKNNKDANQPKNKWNKTIYYIHVIYLVSYIIYGLPVSGLLQEFPYFINYIQVSIMCVMVMYLAYMASVQPEVFKNENVILKELIKYQKSGLTNAFSQELKENLVKLLVEEKIFKQNNLNLEELSQKLNTTRHNTSQIINEHFKMNFFELINKFRVNEAIKILEGDVYGSLNIIDIAYDVGYNNKVTFNKAFKKETKLTPSEYIQSKPFQKDRVKQK